jgi:hypothetical protein
MRALANINIQADRRAHPVRVIHPTFLVEYEPSKPCQRQKQKTRRSFPGMEKLKILG